MKAARLSNVPKANLLKKESKLLEVENTKNLPSEMTALLETLKERQMTTTNLNITEMHHHLNIMSLFVKSNDKKDSLQGQSKRL